MTLPHLPSSGPTYHTIIVGAGWYGLAAAKTYLALHPSLSLLLIDAEMHVGGVWSRSRIYPRLVVNQPTPMFEYSDLSMKEVLGVEDWSDISGEMMSCYLEAYAEKNGLIEKCRLGTEVVRVERESGEGKWVVKVRPTGSGYVELEELKCEKLIMATGHTSNPKFPDNLNTSLYTGKIFHVKEIGKKYYDLLKEDDVKTITVVGGNKSSFELAGLFALEGKKVNWLIREEGAGPGMLMKDRPDGKRHMMKGTTMRAISAVAPTLYKPKRWITRFLYSGKHWLCRWFVGWFFKSTLKVHMKIYEKPNRRILKPLSDSLFWISAGLSQIHCHDDAIFDLIDEGKLINISRTAIKSLKGRALTLSNGSIIRSDVVILATGWQLAYSSIFDPSLAVELGLPTSINYQRDDHLQYWNGLDKAAEEEVLTLYPILREPPAHLNLSAKPAKSTTPLRNFRLIAPPTLAARHDRSIVFLGNIVIGQISTHAEASALWSVAYLEDMFPSSPIRSLLEDKRAMDADIATSNAYFKLRYLDLLDVPLSVFEMREVIDRLLLDLGLRADRKGRTVERDAWWGWKAWLKEWFEPYKPNDYRGIVEEFTENTNSGKM